MLECVRRDERAPAWQIQESLIARLSVHKSPDGPGYLVDLQADPERIDGFNSDLSGIGDVLQGSRIIQKPLVGFQGFFLIRHGRTFVLVGKSLSDGILARLVGFVHPVPIPAEVAMMFLQRDQVPPILALVAVKRALILIHVEVIFPIPAEGADLQDDLTGLKLIFKSFALDIFKGCHVILNPRLL